MNTHTSPDDGPTELDECLSEKRSLHVENERLKRREKKLLHRLYYHEKTGFPNHAGLSRDLGRLLGRSRKADGRIAVMFVALDATFDMLKKAQKSVLGEWVLYKTAHSIQSIVRRSGRVYQTKSNEFAVLLTGVTDAAECRECLDRIASKTGEMHRFPGQTISVGCNIGCALYPDHGENEGDLLRNADIALSFATNFRRNGLLYDASMSDEISERISIQDAILHALEEQARLELETQFRLEFQPLVRIVDLNGHGLRTRTIGSECLLRWEHPQRGIIEPDRFIPLAEENGLIIPIGNWVFYRAARHIREWRSRGHKGLFLSVNLSPIQFGDVYLVDNISRLLERQELAPDALQIEITETAVMDDPEQASKRIDALHGLGVRMSIDDFGTGYSSLAYLRDLKVDTLKIDKSFVQSISESSYDESIVRAIVTMARSLGMDVLAEGIERMEQVELLYRIGCHNLQGYLFSRPLPGDEFERYLAGDGTREQTAPTGADHS